MYSNIDLQALQTMLQNARDTVEIKMTDWWCGTAGCLVGTYCHYNPTNRMQIDKNTGTLTYDGGLLQYYVLAEHFGLPILVADFLFTSHRSIKSNNYTVLTRSACSLTREQAIARLEKYINYVIRKRRMWDNYAWQRSIPRSIRRALEMTV